FLCRMPLVFYSALLIPLPYYLDTTLTKGWEYYYPEVFYLSHKMAVLQYLLPVQLVIYLLVFHSPFYYKKLMIISAHHFGYTPPAAYSLLPWLFSHYTSYHTR